MGFTKRYNKEFMQLVTAGIATRSQRDDAGGQLEALAEKEKIEREASDELLEEMKPKLMQLTQLVTNVVKKMNSRLRKLDQVRIPKHGWVDHFNFLDWDSARILSHDEYSITVRFHLGSHHDIDVKIPRNWFSTPDREIVKEVKASFANALQNSQSNVDSQRLEFIESTIRSHEQIVESLRKELEMMNS